MESFNRRLASQIEPLEYLDKVAYDCPWTHRRACHLLYYLTLAYNTTQVVEVSCCYGKASIYLATGAKQRGGFLRTTDIEKYEWQGKSASDLLREVSADDATEVTFGIDARVYLLDLFTKYPGQWVDVFYLDLSHTLEVDSFAAVAGWHHLRPGGILIMDDLDWIPSIHGMQDSSLENSNLSLPHESNMRIVYDYLKNNQEDVDFAEWGKEEIQWPMGFLKKPNIQADSQERVLEFLRRLDRQASIETQT